MTDSMLPSGTISKIYEVKYLIRLLFPDMAEEDIEEITKMVKEKVVNMEIERGDSAKA